MLIPKASPFLRQLFRFIAFDLSDGVRRREAARFELPR